MSSDANQFVLPDLVSMCPLDDAISPHYKKAAAESRAWIDSYSVFTGRKRAFLLSGITELLTARAYAYADYDQLRTCCDLVNLLYLFDELSDEQTGQDAHTTSNIFLRAMTEKGWDDGSVFCKITKEFLARFLRISGPKATSRFLKDWEVYCHCVVREAELREKGRVLDPDSYTELRRENSGVRPCFGIIEGCFGIDLPDEVFQNSTFIRIYLAALDLVCWSNDVYSYDMEQSRGIEGNNIVTVLMTSNNMTLQEAADHVGVHFKELMDCFMSTQAHLPSWGVTVDSGVKRYIHGLGSWVRGNLDWCFESERFFGVKHQEVKETRLVTLRPRVSFEETT